MIFTTTILKLHAMSGFKLCVLFFISLLAILITEGIVFSDNRILRLATTTSTDNTGLLDYLAPYIGTVTGIELQWIAVGTRNALELGKNCDVDVLIVHAPESEEQFIRNGYGVNRRNIMYNDFVVIGPEGDPAGIKGKPLSEALKIIASRQVVFVSRGDDSGTHSKESSLWKSAGLPVPDKESWYIQTGQGMLSTINISAEMSAYTLTDRGTFIKYESNWKGNPPLVILLEGDRSLQNQYSVIAVNPDRCKNVKYDLAEKFINWIISPPAQKLIGDFKLMGNQLFIPNAEEN